MQRDHRKRRRLEWSDRDALAARFEAKVDRSPGHGPDGECHVFTGKARAHYGYGLMGVAGTNQRAHRIAWYLTHGELPDLYVLHRCDNPLCVNPEHLFLGTQRDNMRDMRAKGRGHIKSPLTPEQVYAIRALRGVVSSHVVGPRFGVGQSTVIRIWNRQSWYHLPESQEPPHDDLSRPARLA